MLSRCLLCLGGPSRPFVPLHSAVGGSFSLGSSSTIVTHAGCVGSDGEQCASQAGVLETELELLMDVLPDLPPSSLCFPCLKIHLCFFQRFVWLAYCVMGLKRDEYEAALVCHLLNGLCAHSMRCQVYFYSVEHMLLHCLRSTQIRQQALPRRWPWPYKARSSNASALETHYPCSGWQRGRCSQALIDYHAIQEKPLMCARF